MRLISKANMVQIAFGGERERRVASSLRSECGIASCRFKTPMSREFAAYRDSRNTNGERMVGRWEGLDVNSYCFD